MFDLPLAPRYLLPPLVLMFFSALLMLPSVKEILVFNRDLIDQGELWRIWTSQYVHTNWMHWLLNVVGVVFIWVLHAEYRSPKVYALHLSILGLWTGVGIWLFCPEIRIYTGLSGLLHGVIVWGAIKDIKVGEKTGILLFLGIAGKLVWEQYAGPSEDVGQLISSRVAIESHLIGALGGLVLAVPLLWQKK
ncbi:rhombosortase [Pseudoalteromonas sp. R3]|uniref:rhombosortase n=1 Tax=Pseudoalteromonas sp. R3 TaxID=1709477 RepID=UPI0006B61C21|nr:rhombosortase [Pseudoalteromonas sp. R3]AZZ98235.1 rhombosortase [Pseudoalteromonas sp. R3]